MEFKKISIENIYTGLYVGRDVLTSSGFLVVKKDTLVTTNIILRLKNYYIKDLYVYSLPEEIQEEYLNDSPKDIEFEDFKENYLETCGEINNSFKHIVEHDNAEEEIKKIVDHSFEIFNSASNSLNMLNMLQKMRHYSDETYLHSLNVGMIGALLGKWLNWPEHEVNLLLSCGLFHDIGKVLVPKEILDKPSVLSFEEFEIIKLHTLKGYELIKDTSLDEVVKQCALSHHEKCNGKGYPFGIEKESINRFVKIITIADIFDAMTSARVYRGPTCPFDVISSFESEGFDLYETEYLLTFLHHLVDAYVHSDVILNNGEQGKVIMINKTKLSRPIVMNLNGQFYDLSKEKSIKINHVIDSSDFSN